MRSEFAKAHPQLMKAFQGVTLPMVGRLEKFFNVKIDIYQKCTYPNKHGKRGQSECRKPGIEPGNRWELFRRTIRN